MPVVAPVGVADAQHRDHQSFLYAIADALHDEYLAIVDAEFDVQIDDAYIASEYDGMVPPGTLDEFRRWADAGVAALNYALRSIPKVRPLSCLLGQLERPHSIDVVLRDTADLILKVNAGGYSLDMANPRQEHEWQVWETVKLREGNVLLPGVVSYLTNVLKHLELIVQRLIRLAKLVAHKNMIASTDCGFAQGPFTCEVHPDIQWAKLSAIAEGARLATEELWSHRRDARAV